MDSTRSITFSIPENVFFHFKNKCLFYDITRSDVLTTLVEKFIDGDFDKEFGIGGFLDAGILTASDRQRK